MDRLRTFRFGDEESNRKLIAALRSAKINHAVSKDGTVRYSKADEESIESELISPIRDELFASWQIATCPEDWIERYRDYMNRNEIPFVEEVINGEVWFLLPRKFRPHLWKFNDREARRRSGAAV